MSSARWRDPAAAREGDPEVLSLALIDARNRTLALLSALEPAFAAGTGGPARADSGHPLWGAGHVGWFAEYWIGRNPRRHEGAGCPADAPRLPSVLADADAIYSGIPGDPRPAPSLSAVRDYLLQTLESTLELLGRTPGDPASLHLYRVVLHHEDLRGEQWVQWAQQAGAALPLSPAPPRPPRAALGLPATRWELGSHSIGWVPDVEREAHRVEVPAFDIDAQPVSWSEFTEFVLDGGYDRQELWHPDGWAWLQHDGRRAPEGVQQIAGAAGAVLQDWFGQPVRMAGTQPALHVAWWEADAYARWAQRRLPTEAEWECAAISAAARGFHWGDVREWTAGTLRPYPGFVADAWTVGSDRQADRAFGRARVQRGASIATASRLRHPRARSWGEPSDSSAFVGFRTCAV